MTIGRLVRGVRRIFIVFFFFHSPAILELFSANMITKLLFFCVCHFGFFFSSSMVSILRSWFGHFSGVLAAGVVVALHLLCNLIGRREQVLHLLYPHIFSIFVFTSGDGWAGRSQFFFFNNIYSAQVQCEMIRFHFLFLFQ